ncbi:hypothetical protein EV361DRAFT_560189 [Lentinula raphanica]|nr:hypothetical protein EV361DRAFT_560189 [Lentinula raphanica]
MSRIYPLVAKRWSTMSMRVACLRKKVFRNSPRRTKELDLQVRPRTMEVQLLKDSTMPKEKNTDENEPRSLERVEETDQEEKIPEAMKVDGESKALIPYRGWPILVPEKRLNMEIQASLRNDSMAFKAWFMLTQGACLCRPWTSLPLRREKISSSWDPHIDEHFVPNTSTSRNRISMPSLIFSRVGFFLNLFTVRSGNSFSKMNMCLSKNILQVSTPSMITKTKVKILEEVMLRSERIIFPRKTCQVRVRMEQSFPCMEEWCSTTISPSQKRTRQLQIHHLESFLEFRS